MNPLMRMAVLAGVETAVRLHIRRGDNLDARDGGGATPLMLAAGRRKSGVVDLLLSAGADPSLTDPSGLDALAHAERSGSAECAALIRAALSPVRFHRWTAGRPNLKSNPSLAQDRRPFRPADARETPKASAADGRRQGGPVDAL
jgi:ankyrin repeat protein